MLNFIFMKILTLEIKLLQIVLKRLNYYMYIYRLKLRDLIELKEKKKNKVVGIKRCKLGFTMKAQYQDEGQDPDSVSV